MVQLIIPLVVGPLHPTLNAGHPMTTGPLVYRSGQLLPYDLTY